MPSNKEDQDFRARMLQLHPTAKLYRVYYELHQHQPYL